MYKNVISSIKPYKFSQYKDISSNEKLAAYACYFLESKKIPLTFSYICIACFKLFPEKFYFDEEFPEYPHIEKLNRTILHLHTGKNLRILVGSVKAGYKMTKAGRILAKQIESDINSSVVDEKISNDKIMDSYKKGIIQDYKKILEDKYYIDFDVSKDEIDINFIWSFFDVIPYTQLSMIKSYLSEVKNYSIFIKDEKCKIFCDMMLSKL